MLLARIFNHGWQKKRGDSYEAHPRVNPQEENFLPHTPTLYSVPILTDRLL